MNLIMNIKKEVLKKLLEISRKRAHLKHNFKCYSLIPAYSGFPCQKKLEKHMLV